MSDLPDLDPAAFASKKNRKDVILVISITLIGIILFALIAMAAPFEDKFLVLLFPKTISSADTGFVCNSCVADVDQNKIVGPADLTVLELCLNKTSSQSDQFGNSCLTADVSRDGIVSEPDLSCVRSQLRNTCD